jgi:imidazolonepropionase
VPPLCSQLHAKKLVDAVDAFCETIAFSPVQTSRVFDAAKLLGLPVRLHGDQLSDQGCGELAAKHGALSCDHCEHTSDVGARAMAESSVVAVLLPASNLFVNESKLPPVEAFRKAGVRMAVGTNCNPGSSPCTSLLMAMHLACSRFRMTPEEALAGVTRHAAAALGLDATIGTVEAGKAADLAIWSCQSPAELSYRIGMNPLIASYVGGKQLWQRGQSTMLTAAPVGATLVNGVDGAPPYPVNSTRAIPSTTQQGAHSGP